MITRTSTILLEGLKDSASGPAWRELDGRYRPLLMAVARRLGLNATDAEDAAQDTLAAFLVDYRQGRYSREAGRLRTWLSAIMTHKVRDMQRRLHRQKQLAGAAARLLEQVEDTSVQAAMDQEWSNAVLRQCLEEIRREVAPQTLESFELCALKQTPVKQVAEQLGISVDVVYQNKRRILQRIRQLLPKMEEIW